MHTTALEACDIFHMEKTRIELHFLCSANSRCPSNVVKRVQRKSVPLTAPTSGSSVFFPTSPAPVPQIYFLFPAEIPEQSGLSWAFFVSMAVVPLNLSFWLMDKISRERSSFPESPEQVELTVTASFHRNPTLWL